MTHMSKNDLQNKLVEIIRDTAQSALTFSPDSTNRSIAIQEIADCTELLINSMSTSTLIHTVRNNTTNGRLYELLKKYITQEQTHDSTKK